MGTKEVYVVTQFVESSCKHSKQYEVLGVFNSLSIAKNTIKDLIIKDLRKYASDGDYMVNYFYNDDLGAMMRVTGPEVLGFNEKEEIYLEWAIRPALLDERAE